MNFFAISLTLLVFCSSLFAQESKINDIGWLSGCWESNKKDANNFVSEQWMKPAGQTMLGMSRTVRKGKTSAFEFLRIVEDSTGIFYISRPSQNKEDTSFKLIKAVNSEFVFENPTHDFPQRIIYRLEKENSLWARIEGNNKGKSMGIDFPMTKVKCD